MEAQLMATTGVRTAPRRFFEDILGPADWATEAQVLAPNVIVHHPIKPYPVVGSTTVKELFKGYRASFPDMTFDLDVEIVANDSVTLIWRAKGTHDGAPLLGHPATHKKFDVTGISVFTVKDDVITEAWIEENSLRLLQQLGLAS